MIHAGVAGDGDRAFEERGESGEESRRCTGIMRVKFGGCFDFFQARQKIIAVGGAGEVVDFGFVDGEVI